MTFLLVFVWKFILLAFAAQPIPANDAFGYDGAVVNYLLNGHYNNPSLAIPFPFSGTQIYSIYPPVYQAVLCLWMSVFGTSALVAMWLHLVLFGLYLLTLLAIFRRLQTRAWAVNLGGLFLFGLTFDDRPDGLAQLFGMLALYAWVRSIEPAKTGGAKWAWLATLLVVVAIFTTPEIGGLYFGWLWLLTLGAAAWRRQKFPLLPMVLVVVAPVALVMLIKLGRPDLWDGFMEHAGQTPSFTHLRMPVLGDFLKIGRNIPGILFVAGIVLWRLAFSGELRTWLPKPGEPASKGSAGADATALLLMFGGLLTSLGLLVAVLFLFAADWILIPGYFQPLMVGVFLMLEGRRNVSMPRWFKPVFAAVILLVSIRAIGISTWGVACSRNVSYSTAMQLARAELDKAAPGSTEIMSTAYLYEAMKYPRLRLIHEDWTHRADEKTGDRNGDTLALIRLKPAALVLTQFDFYRGYQKRLAELRTMPGTVTFTITNTARLPAPDSFPRFQQVVQHISWAPVIVEFQWK